MIKEIFYRMALLVRWQLDNKTYICPVCGGLLTVGFPMVCERCYNSDFLEFIIKVNDLYKIDINSNIGKLLTNFFYNNYHCNTKNLLSIMKREKSLFSPEKLVIMSVKDKLEGENIEKIIFVMSFIDEDKYSIALKPLDNSKPVTFEIKPKDVSLIKKLFVNKIYRSLKEKENYKAVILDCDLKTETLNLFLQNGKDEIVKYDYDSFK